MKNITTLEFSTEIDSTAKELFEFHTNFANVVLITPPIIKTRFISIPVKMEIGSRITIEVNQFGYWMPWEIIIEHLEPYCLMVDCQSGKGPFETWRHEHRFFEHNGKSILVDKISYQLPFGLAGEIIDILLMRFIQKLVFRYRHKKTKEYFKLND